MLEGENYSVGTTPWLTVAMPIHNGAEYLETTLNSLVAEGCQGVEIIALDSSDSAECKNIIENFFDRLSINYIHSTEIKSWTAKTNIAAESARAAHICMLHQDDVWLPGRLRTARQAINSCPEASLYLSPAYIIDSKDCRLGLWRCPLEKKSIWRGDEVIGRLMVQNFIAIPSPIISKRIWHAVGGMDESLWYTADWDLYLKLLCGNIVYYDSTPVTSFRIHPKSLTIKGSHDEKDFRRQMEMVVERYIDILPKSIRDRTIRLSGISIAVNTVLANFFQGRKYNLSVFLKFLLLNPKEIFLYLYYSRIIERIIPRLMAKIYGRFESV